MSTSAAESCSGSWRISKDRNDRQVPRHGRAKPVHSVHRRRRTARAFSRARRDPAEARRDGHERARHQRRSAHSEHWAKIRNLQIVVSIDGLAPEGDVRRALLHLRSHPEAHQRAADHRALHRDTSADDAAATSASYDFWNANPDIRGHLVQLYIAAEGEKSPEIRRKITPRRGRLIPCAIGCRSFATCARACSRLPHAADRSGIMHLREDEARACRRTSEANHAVPVRRRSGLQPVWLHRIRRARCDRPLQSAGDRLKAGSLFWMSLKVGNGCANCRPTAD